MCVIIGAMTYRLYIFIITQLATRKFVVITFGRYNIFFQVDEKRGDWTISLKLSDVEQNNFSQQVKECFSARNYASFMSKSHLTIDHQHGPGIYLVRDIKPTKKYLLFKSIFEELVEEAGDYKDLLCIV